MKTRNHAIKDSDIVEKTLDEMTDGEFLSGISEWSAPLYYESLFVQTSDISVNTHKTSTRVGTLEKNAKVPIVDLQKETLVTSNKNKGNKYTKKRKIFIGLIALLSLVMMVMMVLGIVEYEPITKYTGLFVFEEDYIDILDPVISLIAHIGGIEIQGTDFTYFYENDFAWAYVVAISVIIFGICTALIFIKAMSALFEKRTVLGYYNRRKFGGLSFIALTGAIGCVMGRLFVGGGELRLMLEFLKPGDDTFGVGYGLYAMLLVPIVTMIISGISYGHKKAKK